MYALLHALRTSQRTSSLALFLLAGSLLQARSVNAQTTPSTAAVPNIANPSTPPAGSTTQTSTVSDKPGKKVQTNALGAVATVKDNIAVEAGLLTHDSAKELFGGWVADNYAVVQVTIGNQSRDQQFVLQDIFFDYSNWALSGLYANGTSEDRRGKGLKNYQSSTRPGQISSIGALEIHDALKSNSVFSPRNKVVNGLVLIGTAAGAYSLLGPLGFKEAVTGFTSDVIPGVQKFWPDRSIDQQTNILKYGYQDKLVIAKEDPAKTYAFFPIDRFLTHGLAELYKKQPALFFNPAELFLDPKLSPIVDEHSCGHFKSSDCKAIASLKKTLSDVLSAQLPAVTNISSTILPALVSPCFNGRKTEPDTTQAATSANPDDEEDCPYLADSKQAVGSTLTPLADIRLIKRTLNVASLNSVRIVVSGIMTVDVQQIPPTLTKIEFDGKTDDPAFWSDTTTKQTGVISGKYLANGKPQITIKLADGSKPDLSTYITSIATVDDQSTDSELHFAVQLTKTPIPTGATLSFQVIKSSSKSVNDPGTANTQETTTSMSLDYPVKYTAATPAAAPANPAAAPASNGTTAQPAATPATPTPKGAAQPAKPNKQ